MGLLPRVSGSPILRGTVYHFPHLTARPEHPRISMLSVHGIVNIGHSWAVWVIDPSGNVLRGGRAK